MPESKPRIAIPVPTSHRADYNERCWPQYAAAVEASGGTPVEVPLDASPAEIARLVSSCSGILLPGSPADVHPQKYGEATLPETASPDPLRESADELLLQDAFNLRKPLFGVCYGLQSMNVWRGGTLVQHLQTGHPHAPPEGQVTLAHDIALTAEAPLLREAFSADQAEVNSSHHQSVGVAGDGLRVAAQSVPDGVVEALEGSAMAEHFVLGVQWHPERLVGTDAPSRRLFSAFLEAAGKWRLPA